MNKPKTATKRGRTIKLNLCVVKVETEYGYSLKPWSKVTCGGLDDNHREADAWFHTQQSDIKLGDEYAVTVRPVKPAKRG